jgi:tetratricopeptide (TPR) repeat protein
MSFVLSVNAQQPSWQELYEKAKAMENNKEYAEALKVAEEALKAAEADVGQDDPRLIDLLRNIAWLYRRQPGGHAQANTLTRRALHISEKAFGVNDARVADVAYSLGEFYYFYDELAVAEKLYEQALTIREKSPGQQQIDLGIVLGRLAEIKIKLGKYAEAESLSRREMVVNEESFGPSNWEIIYPLRRLAYLSQVQGRYEEAESRAKEALKFAAKNPPPKELADDYNDIILLDLAEAYRSQGKCSEAVPLYGQAIEYVESELERALKRIPEAKLNIYWGSQAFKDSIGWFRNYADCLRALGRVSEAEEVEGKIQRFMDYEKP